MKYRYYLVINSYVEGKSNTFSYGNTKDISITVSENKATAIALLGIDYTRNKNNKYLIDLARECLRKIMFVHALKYSTNLKIQSVELYTYNDDETKMLFQLPERMCIFSMMEGPFAREIDKSNNDMDSIQMFLNLKKKENGSQLASAYAYLYSKTKKYETERFQYLWIAFNGLYSHYKKNKDKDAIELFLNAYELGSTISSGKNRNSIGMKCGLILYDAVEPVTKDSLINGVNIPVAEEIKTILNEYNQCLTPYGYLLGDYSYYLRCKLFHADSPLLLWGFEDESEMCALRIVNGLLEEFLDENLACEIAKQISINY